MSPFSDPCHDSDTHPRTPASQGEIDVRAGLWQTDPQAEWSSECVSA